MLLRVLGQVRIALRPELFDETRREVGEVLLAGEVLRTRRVAEVPQREPEDVAVQRVIAVIGQPGLQTSLA